MNKEYEREGKEMLRKGEPQTKKNIHVKQGAL
jgi:hypothetical protein